MVTKKRDSKRPKSRGKNISRRPEKIGYCPEEGFDYKAVGLLKKYISETGKIDSAKRNGLSSKCQRSLTSAIKRARHMALLPFASNHNYDTSLLDMGKKNSEKNSNDETDSSPVTTDELDSNEPEDKNSAITDEKKVPTGEKNSNDETDSSPVITDEKNTTTDESDSNEPEDKNSVNNEVVSDESIEEDSQAEDKEKSS